MKKKKQQIPAHSFGLFSAIGQAGEQIGKAAGGDVGQFISGAFNPLMSGLSYLNNNDVSVGNKLLAFTGIGSVFARKQAQRAAERRAEARQVAQNAERNTNMLINDYYSNNDLAYTYAMGGITPSLAYVDDGEILRTPDGDITEVRGGNPNVTDDVLASIPEGTAILSDKLKVPGTNKTFAEMGKKLQKRTKGSKGKDIYAENADKLNKANATAEFNELLTQQEELKQRKGIKNKTKSFALGGINTDYMTDEIDTMYNGIDLITPNIITPESKTKRVLKKLGTIGTTLGTLTPTIYNAVRGAQKPEFQDTVTNPYSGEVIRNLSSRRFNIAPILEANRRSRAVSNYNLNQVSPNTGANLAARSQAAASEYAANASAYATMQNTNNQYRGETAEMLNNLGAQYVRQRNLADDINARNRAAKRNFQSEAASQLGQFAQVQTRMANERSRDAMVMPFLSQFLSSGYDQDMINQLWKQYYNR